MSEMDEIDFIGKIIGKNLKLSVAAYEVGWDNHITLERRNTNWSLMILETRIVGEKHI